MKAHDRAGTLFIRFTLGSLCTFRVLGGGSALLLSAPPPCPQKESLGFPGPPGPSLRGLLLPSPLLSCLLWFFRSVLLIQLCLPSVNERTKANRRTRLSPCPALCAPPWGPGCLPPSHHVCLHRWALHSSRGLAFLLPLPSVILAAAGVRPELVPQPVFSGPGSPVPDTPTRPGRLLVSLPWRKQCPLLQPPSCHRWCCVPVMTSHQETDDWLVRFY